MSESIDVLAALGESIRNAEERGNIERSERLQKVASAVAELIKAAERNHKARNICDRIDSSARLVKALARVKGE